MKDVRHVQTLLFSLINFSTEAFSIRDLKNMFLRPNQLGTVAENAMLDPVHGED